MTREEHPDPPSPAVEKATGLVHQEGLVAESSGELEEEPEGLPLVPAGRFPLQPDEVQSVALAPEQQRHDPGDRGVSVRE